MNNFLCFRISKHILKLNFNLAPVAAAAAVATAAATAIPTSAPKPDPVPTKPMSSTKVADVQV